MSRQLKSELEQRNRQSADRIRILLKQRNLEWVADREAALWVNIANAAETAPGMLYSVAKGEYKTRTRITALSRPDGTIAMGAKLCTMNFSMPGP